MRLILYSLSRRLSIPSYGHYVCHNIGHSTLHLNDLAMLVLSGWDWRWNRTLWDAANNMYRPRSRGGRGHELNLAAHVFKFALSYPFICPNKSIEFPSRHPTAAISSWLHCSSENRPDSVPVVDDRGGNHFPADRCHALRLPGKHEIMNQC